MRLVWGITIAVCLGFPAWGVVCQQQETPGPANATAQAPASAPQNESPPEQKTETPAETKTEPKTESQQTEPQIPPKTEAQPDEVKPEQTKKADANGGPRKVVVREGGADEPTAQIVTGMAPEEANRKRQAAEQLLKATDATVKRTAPGPVDAQRQETVSQIHNYMQGARAALKEGDISRGHTLAVKANLLADDLARH
jgi:cytoskeletal protein RodZ